MHKLCAITTSNWIDIIGIIITSIIGIWIGSTVQKNLTRNRALKEYYINEIKLISEEYSIYLNCLYKGKTTSKSSQEWFKIMNIKIDTIQSSIVAQLKTLPEILANHISMKQFVTNSTEFNSCYQESALHLNPSTKDTILQIHSNLKASIVKAIIDINKA